MAAPAPGATVGRAASPSCAVVTRASAWATPMTPSSTRSTAIRTAAAAARIPARRLQDVQDALLDGELDVDEVPAGRLGEADRPLQSAGSRRDVGELGERPRPVRAVHDVDAMGRAEEVPAHAGGSRPGVAARRDAAAAGRPPVAEGHGLHHHGGPEPVVDAVAVG